MRGDRRKRPLFVLPDPNPNSAGSDDSGLQKARKVRILIADDHELIREGLRRQIETREDWEVCGEATNGRDVVTLAATLQPDVVILDLDMPEIQGLEAARLIKAARPATEIMIYTADAHEEMIHNAIQSGVSSYIAKTDIGDHLLAAIEALSQHKPYMTERIEKLVMERYFHPKSCDEVFGLFPK